MSRSSVCCRRRPTSSRDLQLMRAVSMSWIDNIFIERLRRSVEYKDVYLRAYASGREARTSLTGYFAFYNGRRVHESGASPAPSGRENALRGKTIDEDRGGRDHHHQPLGQIHLP
jgi:hypothetical protein